MTTILYYYIICYTTLYCTTLHCTTLHYTTLHYNILVTRHVRVILHSYVRVCLGPIDSILTWFDLLVYGSKHMVRNIGLDNAC